MEKAEIRANLLTLIGTLERHMASREKELMFDFESRDPYMVRDSQGNYVLMPLVIALANAYSALANLEGK